VGHTQPLSKVENAFRGEACFLLGTGPSIKALDLKALHQFPLIGVNGAIAVMQPLGLRPRHYTVTDLDFFANRFSMIRAVIESGSDCFFSAGGLRIIAERAPELLRQGEHFYLSEVVNRAHDQPRRSQETFLEWASQIPSLVLPSPPRDDDSRVGWSRDLRHGVFCSRTILFRALQMAAFLGYRRLYVLGMDLNYRGPASRAYEEGKDARPTKIERDFEPFILPAFRVLQQEIDEGRLEVFNLSNASRLPESVIPRLSLEAALERERA
jgi:KDO transferase-3